MCEKKSGFLEGLTLGAVLAGMAVVFFGTDQGKKIQKNLKKKAGPIIEDLIFELEEKSAELLEKAEEVKEEVTEKIEEVKETLDKETGEKIDESLSRIQVLQERGRKVVAALRAPKFFKGINKKPAA